MALEVTRAPDQAGIVVLGPHMPFEPPPPFDEFFEPIRLLGGTGGRDPRLVTLSGEKPTRDERLARIGLPVLYCLALVAAAALLVSALQTRSLREPGKVLTGLMGTAAILWAALALGRLGRRWYLVPGGVAIVRRIGTPRARILVCTPRDTAASLRYVSTGKTTALLLELWRAERHWKRVVSEREAISFLAAWRSGLAPPAMAQLRELFS